MDNNRNTSKELNKEVRVMEVFHFTKDEMHVDYFTKKEYIEVIESFFIKGGLNIPAEVDDTKTIDELTEDDCKVFFEELGYDVAGFSNYNPDYHKDLTVPFSYGKLTENKDNES